MLSAYIPGRHALIQEMFESADAILVPSNFILDRLSKAYPALSRNSFRVVPQGVAIPDSPSRSGQNKGRVLAYFGGDLHWKGAGLVLHLARSLTESAVTFRIFGRTKGFDPASMPPNVELHGFYMPDDVGKAMEGVDLALLPSHFEESYSMIASECWAHGVPVLSSNRGALDERVIDGVNGWLVSDLKPETWLQSLRKILEGDDIEQCRNRLSRHDVTSIEQSAGIHRRLYEQLLEMPKPAPVAASPCSPSRLLDKKLEAFRSGAPRARKSSAVHCLGIVRDHWGTANYRVRFPLEQLARSAACDSSQFHVVLDAGFDVEPALKKAGAGHIAIQPYLTDQGLKLMELLHRETDFDIALVVDDLWTELPLDNPVRAQLPDDIPVRLRYAASLSNSLVLTTDEQRRRLGIQHDNTYVIANGLPEWIWGALPALTGKPGKRLRIGWAGAAQHASDLAFLGQVMKDTADLADWVFLGMCPEELRPLANEVHPMVPFDQYPAALSALGLDLGIAPLTDHAFNRCKSNLKVLEYGILGIPVVASDLEPYLDCPVSFAAPDDAGDWTAMIRSLLANTEARLEQGGALRQWVLENHMMEHRRPDWEVALGIRADA